MPAYARTSLLLALLATSANAAADPGSEQRRQAATQTAEERPASLPVLADALASLDCPIKSKPGPGLNRPGVRAYFRAYSATWIEADGGGRQETVIGLKGYENKGRDGRSRIAADARISAISSAPSCAALRRHP